ncbi:cellulose 1,4-beta-cellobiosidase [Prauserella shujinwangii]|uniref:Cellulose 1,4-beta-cellobiosidase n=1 Tax=Prauserella shujinwangii TaxID=1453103 RepID=A0A2T0M2E6_9PSEU|nr:glycoside hydrolase family 48 protein [Prauserella shujinwangii]PRX50925.1 cellulose 1,4-beta-cellobiosidase [Prauserella shujinwangii]
MRSRRRARPLRAGPVSALLALTALTALTGVATVNPLPASAAAVQCTVDYRVVNEWDTGFGAGVTIRNAGAEPIDGWELTWTFQDGQRVTDLWNGTVSQDGGAVSVRNAGWNATIPVSGSVEFGFNAAKSGANRAPADFAVNGTPCTGPNEAPDVRLTAPADNATYTVPAAIDLRADATDGDGTVSRVEFYAGTELLGTDTSAPFEYTWTGAEPGRYSVTARAHDDGGASATSAPIAVQVLGAPAIRATPSEVNLRQGTTATLDVRLATSPAAPVTVTVERTSGSADLTATPTALSFDAGNWSSPRQVTIASADNGGAPASATFTLSAPGHAEATVTATELDPSTSDYETAFLTQYHKIKDPDSGYFRQFGDLLVPYHSVETLIVEAPDHGHQTTSEAFSYYLWLEAAYGRIQGDWEPFVAAWESMETYLIPSAADQPTNAAYDPGSPATYAPESPRMEDYPVPLDSGVPVGSDPIADELAATYGTDDIYGMHWLLDVDNTYGFGRCGDGTTAPAYLNTYQRGSSESVWETIPQPSCDTFAFGGPNGYLDLFVEDAQYARQWKYTNAPDADARAVQVAYLANQWATEQGKGAQIGEVVEKASKMGDYLRYAMFDKYFKRIGDCVGAAACPGGAGRDSQHYLMSWYYAWGGAYDTSAGWAWRIGDGAAHQGYQNPMAAHALANDPALRPDSPTGARDWGRSLDRQLEFLQWLQSAEGGIAGGATNSWDGQYGQPPAGSPTFYGMFYDWQPVWHDPPSNRWFGFQVWGLERVAQLYEQTGDERAKRILDRWVPWAIAHTTVGENGEFAIPSDMEWSGAPDTWNPDDPGDNGNLHVDVVSTSQDVGVAAAYAKVLLNYAAASGDGESRAVGEGLLDALLAHTDSIGIATEETRTDYARFDDEYDPASGEGTYVPPGWTGQMPNGDDIGPDSTFLSLRSFYQDDPQWPKVRDYLDGGPAPTFTYHRFWAQAEIATAFSTHVRLFG